MARIQKKKTKRRRRTKRRSDYMSVAEAQLYLAEWAAGVNADLYEGRLRDWWREYGDDPDASLAEIRRRVDRWTDSGARLSAKAKGTGRPPSPERVECRRLLYGMRARFPDWLEATRRVAKMTGRSVRWVRRDKATRW